jgi:hypothetical protein
MVRTAAMLTLALNCFFERALSLSDLLTQRFPRYGHGTLEESIKSQRESCSSNYHDASDSTKRKYPAGLWDQFRCDQVNSGRSRTASPSVIACHMVRGRMRKTQNDFLQLPVAIISLAGRRVQELSLKKRSNNKNGLRVRCITKIALIETSACRTFSIFAFTALQKARHHVVVGARSDTLSNP